MNLDKSSVIFSSNVPIDYRKMIEGVLGIKAANNPGIYLGIPSFWGKTKCEAFGYVRERVEKKLTGVSTYLSRSGQYSRWMESPPIKLSRCDWAPDNLNLFNKF